MQIQELASQGIRGPAGTLPHLETIQRSFGRHDVSGIRAHTDHAAASAADAMDAEAFSAGQHVAFAGVPTLHTVAHEAAHVIQQRAGLKLPDGVGRADDSHEGAADAVADRVVQGQSVEGQLDSYFSSHSSSYFSGYSPSYSFGSMRNDPQPSQRPLVQRKLRRARQASAMDLESVAYDDLTVEEAKEILAARAGEFSSISIDQVLADMIKSGVEYILSEETATDDLVLAINQHLVSVEEPTESSSPAVESKSKNPGPPVLNRQNTRSSKPPLPRVSTSRSSKPPLPRATTSNSRPPLARTTTSRSSRPLAESKSPLPKVRKKSEMPDMEYDLLSYNERVQSHVLEFNDRPAEVFGANDYLYHATATAALSSIQVSGINTSKDRGNDGADPSKYCFISAAKSVKGAGSLNSKSSLLRFKPSLHAGEWKAYGAADEVRSMTIVPAAILEVFVENEWKPLL